MHRVNIIGSQLVAGNLRYQHENPIEVSDKEAERLKNAGALLEDPVPVPSKKPSKRKPAPEPATADVPPASDDKGE